MSAATDARRAQLGRLVYVWATGQLDNIGDSLLRRPYLEFLRRHGDLMVWTGGAGDRFLSGLGLHERDEILGDFWLWYRRALRGSLSRGTIIALNAGEFSVSRRGALRVTMLVVPIVIAKMRGGSGIWVGAGIPERRSLLVLPYRLVAKLCTGTRWRDAGSKAMAKSGAVVPDWAFGLGTDVSNWGGHERRVLAIVVRGDRPSPTPEWAEWVRATAIALSLRIVCVVQVRRDTDRAHELAALLNGTVVEYNDDHAFQEATVRAEYRQALIVLGDRLHGLIVGATEGAIPLGWVPSSRGKIRKHFDVVGLGWTGEFEGREPTAYPALQVEEIVVFSEQLHTAVASARARLADAARDLSGELGRRDGSL